MRFLLNLLWVILGGGLLIWVEYLIAGVLLCLTIVGIPFGLQCFKIAWLGLLPFGKDIEDLPQKNPVSGTLALVLNVIWLLIAGVPIFVTHVGLAIPLALSVIGIPFAIQHVKLAALAIWPFGRQATS